MTSQRDDDELLLTAFRYVSGELPASESVRFEARLADDLQAQQALADAVLLGDALTRSAVVATVRSGPQTLPQRAGRVGAVLAVAAVALLILVSLWPTSSGVRDQSLTGMASRNQAADRSVLDVWSDLAGGEAGNDAVDPGAIGDIGIDGGDDEAPVGEEIPEWLLHAVAGTQSGDDDAAPGPAADESPPADEIDEAT